MKIATLLVDGIPCAASVDPEAGTARLFTRHDTPISVADLIALYPDPATLPPAGGRTITMTDVALMAPIPRPARNVMCIGKNYLDHAREFAKGGSDTSGKPADVAPKAPIVFTKAPECVIPGRAAIRYPTGLSEKVDYEAELAVILGTGGRGISEAEAMSHVWGYTILNDVTARDLQARHTQWFLGKSLDTFCPMGPWILTADEAPAEGFRIRCWVDGELRQDGHSRDLIFPIPTLIRTLSAGLTLQPGDIIATGTPAGVGLGFDPPRLLKPGSVVRIEIDGIGFLENPVVAG